jgi:hypothetical protein
LQLLLHSMRKLLQSGHVAWRFGRRRRHGGERVDELKGRQNNGNLRGCEYDREVAVVAGNNLSFLLMCAVPRFLRLWSQGSAHTQGRYENSSTSTHPPATTTAVAFAGATRNSGSHSRIRVVPPNATLLSIRRERAGLCLQSRLCYSTHNTEVQ